MPNILAFDLNQYFLFFLIVVRVSGLIFVAPLFSAKQIPRQIRAGLVLIISLIFYNLAPSGFSFTGWTVADYFTIVSKELMIGLLIGIIPRLMFAGIELAGSLVGYQMGFAVVNVVDPTSNSQISIIASFQVMIATLLLVLFDGHLIFLDTLFQSYQKIPIGGFLFSSGKIDVIIRLSAEMFVIGLKLAGLFIVPLLLANTVMGLLARSIPQLNVFVVGFPLTIGLGLFLLIVGMPYFVTALKELFFSLDKQIIELLTLITK
ncbi:MAG: flagellar biosynthetic protein FliR [bacterium]|jgi:flagellar biosynthetic protein FliR